MFGIKGDPSYRTTEALDANEETSQYHPTTSCKIKYFITIFYIAM